MSSGGSKGASGRRARLAVHGQPPARVERADAARNRQRILEAARALLAARPIDEIAMDDVAAAAGVGKGTLYRRFEDRGSLCRALLDAPARALQDAALAGFGVAFGPPWIAHAVRLWEALFDFSVAHLSVLAEATAYKRGAERYSHPAHVWQRDLLARYLARAAAGGEIRAVDAELTADAALALLAPEFLAHRLGCGDPGVLKAGLRRHWTGGVSLGGASASSDG